ncbi:MAG: putative GCN5-related N-acetyltransferase [Acidimicrobiales bacterium]|nr:putative GCN5-related N-acetyltransferase [Acidimicrobiales bacterium]
MAPFPIRPRTEQDLAGVAALLLATHHSHAYPVYLPSDLRSWGAAEGVIDAWVATDAGAGTGSAGVVGHVVLTEVDDDEATEQWVAATGRPWSGLVAVRRLVVHERAHGTGTGRALLKTAVAAAHGLGRRPVLDMSDNLDAAARLYAAEGFEVVGNYDLDLSGHLLHVITWVGPEPP